LSPTSSSPAAAKTPGIIDLATVYIEDLEGRRAPAHTGSAEKAIVFLFVRTDCPISNRYAPEMRRLHKEFAAQGVRFRLVYPSADEKADAIRKHLAQFELPDEAVRDPSHSLARACGVTTTPQAAVFLPDGESMVYRGRIDDRYVDFGVSRQAPRTHDLEEALWALVANREVAAVITPAVGCPIGEPR
jgi:hypothetical protein